jgi:hypothetical protein
MLNGDLQTQFNYVRKECILKFPEKEDVLELL